MFRQGIRVMIVGWVAIVAGSQNATKAQSCVPDLTADANSDYVVDPLDVGYVLARFGCPVGTCDAGCDAADVNGDGIVDPLDSGYILARFCSEPASEAFDVHWLNPAGGPWSVGSNWSTGLPPLPSEDAVIDLEGDYTVTLDISPTITGLTLGAACGTQTLTLTTSTLTLDGSAIISEHGELILQGGTWSIAQDSSVDGVFKLSGGTVGGAGNLSIAGTLSWAGATMSGAGTTTIEPGATWSLPGPGSATLSRPLINHGNGTMSFFGFNMGLLNGTFTNAADGTVNMSSGAAFSNFGGTNSFTNQGTLKLTGSGGTFSVPITNAAGGVVQGVGTLGVGGTTFSNAGIINPGLSAGPLTIVGALPNTSTAVINIEIGGLVSGTEYDSLNIIGGLVTLDGTLNISLINGFQPSLGQTFTIMTYGSKTGAFDTITGLSLGGGLIFSPTFGATSVTLTVVSR